MDNSCLLNSGSHGGEVIFTKGLAADGQLKEPEYDLSYSKLQSRFPNPQVGVGEPPLSWAPAC